MARKNDSPQKAAMRKMMQEYLKNNDINIKSGTDVNSVMREMMSVLLEGALDEELNEELGYSKYDYKNKNKDNSRNGHSQKTMHTSYGDMDISIPRDRNGEYEPQLVKKYQNTVTQDMEEKIISMYAKGMTGTTIGRYICSSVYGCYPLSCTLRRTYRQTCCIHSSGYRYERQKRCVRHVCRRK